MIPSDREALLVQIPTATWMFGINSPACVQVAFVEIPRTGRSGRTTRRRTPATTRIRGINSSASIQGTWIVIGAAFLSVSRGRLPQHKDRGQYGQDPEDSTAHDHPSMIPGVSLSKRQGRRSVPGDASKFMTLLRPLPAIHRGQSPCWAYFLRARLYCRKDANRGSF